MAAWDPTKLGWRYTGGSGWAGQSGKFVSAHNFLFSTAVCMDQPKTVFNGKSQPDKKDLAALRRKGKIGNISTIS